LDARVDESAGEGLSRFLDQGYVIGDRYQARGYSISTLQSLNMIKCWKGQHVIYVKQEAIDEYMKQNKQLRLCHSEYLIWEPPKERKKSP
jgi:hypothetical protein